MPTYDYKCPQCSGRFEQNVTMDERAVAPMCGDCIVPMERVYSSAPGVIFRGNGWGSKP